MQYSIIGIYHYLSILLLYGHLLCFQVLTIMNRVAINVLYRYLGENNYSFLLSTYPGVGFAFRFNIINNIYPCYMWLWLIYFLFFY